MDTITKHPILRAADHFGSQSALAEKLGVHPSMISQIANGRRKAPIEMCKDIEAITDGSITRADLRPDIFGEPTQAA